MWHKSRWAGGRGAALLTQRAEEEVLAKTSWEGQCQNWILYSKSQRSKYFCTGRKTLCFEQITSQPAPQTPSIPIRKWAPGLWCLYGITFCPFSFTSSSSHGNETINPVHKIGISRLLKVWFGKHPFPAPLNKILADAGSHPSAKAIIHVGCGVWTDFK